MISFRVILTVLFGAGTLFYTEVGRADEYSRARVQLAENIVALQAAFDTAERERLETVDKTIVITRQNHFLVISFINTRPQKGGQSHIVFDPRISKVVSFTFEE